MSKNKSTKENLCIFITCNSCGIMGKWAVLTHIVSGKSQISDCIIWRFSYFYVIRYISNINDYNYMYPKTYHNVSCFLPLHMKGPLSRISSVLPTWQNCCYHFKLQFRHSFLQKNFLGRYICIVNCSIF